MTKTAKLYAVIPAAGVGSRMGSDKPKQYLTLLGKTVVEHTLERLLAEPLLQQLVVAVNPDDQQWPQLDLARHPRIKTVDGGAERSDSVLNGLRALDGVCGPEDWVLVHDVARPCMQSAELHRLITQLGDHSVGGILAMPLSDTIKTVNAQCSIVNTVDRSRLWRAQTPQMFRYGLLTAALNVASELGLAVTDEASAVEAAGFKPVVVEGAATNIKITRPEDLPLAEFYLSTQKHQ